MKFWPERLGCLSILAMMTAAVDGEADAQVKAAMEKHEIVPDVIPKAPEDLLEVQYNDTQVNLGTVLTPAAVAKKPKVSWKGDQNSFYTLCMIDPDAPSRTNHKAREWLHWLVGNIPGSEVDRGNVICTYAGATPPQGTGLHRYVLLVYKQPGKLKFDEPKINDSGGTRAKFSVSKFADKHDLGDPVAGNFFQAKA